MALENNSGSGIVRRTGQLVTQRLLQARKAALVSRNATMRNALKKGTAASIEHTALVRRLQPATVVDIGANRGQFSVLCHALLPEVTIIAFEPLPDAAARYRALDLGPNVRLVQAAVAPHAGEATMHRSKRDDSSSLLPIGARQVENFPGTEEASTETVRTVRLDEAVNADEIVRPSLLKIDVQGFEMQVLHASEPLLDRFDWILAELSLVELYEGQALASEVISWLHTRGFELREITHVSHGATGRSVQADLLFAR